MDVLTYIDGRGVVTHTEKLGVLARAKIRMLPNGFSPGHPAIYYEVTLTVDPPMSRIVDEIHRLIAYHVHCLSDEVTSLAYERPGNDRTILEKIKASCFGDTPLGLDHSGASSTGYEKLSHRHGLTPSTEKVKESVISNIVIMP